jgi:aminopeptidase
MRDPRLNKLAEVVVRHCTQVRKGDLVAIHADPACMTAVEALFEAVLRAGGHPSFHPRSDTFRELILRHGTDEQIRHVSPFEAHRLATCDVLIVLNYESNTRSLGRADPNKLGMAQAARRDLLTMSLQRLAQKESRYCLTEIPGNAAAQDAGMSLRQYEDWVFRAGHLHLPDPVSVWRSMRERQEQLTSYLQTTHTLRIQSPASTGSGGARRHDGTDLTLDVSGRTWLNRAGDENFPDGEVETGPRAVDGIVNFTFPTVFRGREMDGVRLHFRHGRVVDASASKNEDFLFALLDQDEGARGVGEFALGTNYEITDFTRNTFFDEKIGGTFHLALGAGYPQTGNTNESGLHMDLVSDLRPGGAFPGSPGGTVHADGELLHRDGVFVGPFRPGS